MLLGKCRQNENTPQRLSAHASPYTKLYSSLGKISYIVIPTKQNPFLGNFCVRSLIISVALYYTPYVFSRLGILDPCKFIQGRNSTFTPIKNALHSFKKYSHISEVIISSSGTMYMQFFCLVGTKAAFYTNFV